MMLHIESVKKTWYNYVAYLVHNPALCSTTLAFAWNRWTRLSNTWPAVVKAVYDMKRMSQCCWGSLTAKEGPIISKINAKFQVNHAQGRIKCSIRLCNVVTSGRGCDIELVSEEPELVVEECEFLLEEFLLIDLSSPDGQLRRWPRPSSDFKDSFSFRWGTPFSMKSMILTAWRNDPLAFWTSVSISGSEGQGGNISFISTRFSP